VGFCLTAVYYEGEGNRSERGEKKNAAFFFDSKENPPTHRKEDFLPRRPR